MEYTAGATLKHAREIKETWATGLAQVSDITIMCVGYSSFLEGEKVNLFCHLKMVIERAFLCRRARWTISKKSHYRRKDCIGCDRGKPDRLGRGGRHGGCHPVHLVSGHGRWKSSG